MERPITQELMQALLSLALGAGVGTAYDFLRELRRAGGRLAAVLCDLVFCAGLCFGLFAFGLGPGEGSLRLFMLACMGGGWALYALTASMQVRKIFGFLVGKLCRACRPLRRSLSKLRKLEKNQKSIFPKFLAGFTMMKNRRKNEGSAGTEARKGSYDYACSGGVAVRAGKPHGDGGPAEGLRARARRARGFGQGAGRREDEAAADDAGRNG